MGTSTQLRVRVDSPKVGQTPRNVLDTLLKEHYAILDTIGQGSTSVVQRAIRRSDGLHVVVKRLAVSSEPEHVHLAQAEYALLQKLRHPNIIRVLDFRVACGCAAMIMEHVGGGTLEEAVTGARQGRLEESSVQRLAFGLLSGLSYVHGKKVLHRDVKPSNVVVSSDLRHAKLIDFNVAHDLARHGPALTPTGTRLYAAPEVIFGEPPDESADVWSAGLCLFFALSGQLPQQRQQCRFSGSGLHNAASCEVEFAGGVWSAVNQACVEFLASCLALDVAGRPVAADLMRDPWLQADGRVDN